MSYPARCQLDSDLEFLPEPEQDGEVGVRVQREFEDWIARAAAADPWLRVHSPQVEWLLGAVPPAEVSPDEDVVKTLLATERDIAVAALRFCGPASTAS